MNPYEFENHEPHEPRHKLKNSDRRLILIVAVGLTIVLLVMLGIYWSEG